MTIRIGEIVRHRRLTSLNTRWLESRRQWRATPLLGVLLLAALICYGFALHLRAASGARTSTVSRPPQQLAAPHPPLAQPPFMLAMTAPPAVNSRRRQRVLPRSAIQPATGALPRQLPRHWLESKAAGNRYDDALLVVDAGLHEPARNTVRLGMRPATALGDVPVHPAPAPTPAHTMPVWVTGYTLTGTTALGTSAGPGICAVDPAFIYLGTRITISGVGACVAQDTGPEVLGAHIDVWVPTVSQAYAITGWHTASW